MTTEAAVTAPATAVEAPTSATTTPASNPMQEPEWMAARNRRAQVAALKTAGIKVGKNDDPKAVAAEAREKSQSRKAELRTERARADAAEAKATELSATHKIYADAELATLTDKQREIIKSVAGDDPSKVLETIATFKLAGGFSAAPPPAVVSAPVVAPAVVPATPVEAPASTSPASPAPAPATTQDPEDTAATYRNLKASNPYLAAQFILNNPDLVPEIKRS